MTRKAATIRKDLDRAALALDKTVRAVYQIVGNRTDIRLCDIIAAHPDHDVVLAREAALAKIAALRDEMRWA
jgi:hypothetical protein